MAKYDSAEERKGIEETLESMQEYFADVQKAESSMEEALGQRSEPEEAEDQARREEAMNKVN